MCYKTTIWLRPLFFKSPNWLSYTGLTVRTFLILENNSYFNGPSLLLIKIENCTSLEVYPEAQIHTVIEVNSLTGFCVVSSFRLLDLLQGVYFTFSIKNINTRQKYSDSNMKVRSIVISKPTKEKYLISLL